MTSSPPGTLCGLRAFPADGEVHVSYDGRTATATLTNTSLHTPQTRVEINGTAGQKLNLKLQARAADLTEVDALIAAFQGFGQERSTSSSSPVSVNLAVTADLQLLVEGPAIYRRIR